VPLASLSDVVATAPISFVIGLVVGVLIASRYHVVKWQNGKGPPPP
jgi:hypothetical protein